MWLTSSVFICLAAFRMPNYDLDALQPTEGAATGDQGSQTQASEVTAQGAGGQEDNLATDTLTNILSGNSDGQSVQMKKILLDILKQHEQLSIAQEAQKCLLREASLKAEKSRHKVIIFHLYY